MEKEEASPQRAELKSVDPSQSKILLLPPSPHWEDSQALTALRISYIPKSYFQHEAQFFTWITSLTSQPAVISLICIFGLLAQWANQLLIVTRVHELNGCTIPGSPQSFPVLLSCAHTGASSQAVLEDSMAPTHTVGSGSAPFQRHSFLKCALSAIATHVVVTCRERHKNRVINQSLLQQNNSELWRYKMYVTWTYTKCNLNLNLLNSTIGKFYMFSSINNRQFFSC